MTPNPLPLAAAAAEAVEDCPLFDIACRTAGEVGAEAGVPGGDRIREMFQSMAAGVLEWAATWWIEVPGLSTADGFASQLRWHVLTLSMFLLVLGMVIQAGRMIWMRRAAPLVDALAGLSTYVLAVGLAVPVTAGGMLAGDAFSAWVLDDAVDQQVAAEVVLLLAQTREVGVVVLLGLLAALAGVALAAVMMLREVAVLLLAATVPLAAAGRLIPGLANWLPSVVRLVIALALWKPAAALIYASGARLMVEEEPRSLLVGVVTLALTVAALPALIRWLTPVAAGAVGSLTGTGTPPSARGVGLIARGPTVQQQAARIERDFGSPAGRRIPPAGVTVARAGGPGPTRTEGARGIAGHYRRDGTDPPPDWGGDEVPAGVGAERGDRADPDRDGEAPPLWGPNTGDEQAHRWSEGTR
ncbi:hypothetical protein [Nitriliruptor alkaliphilus]|uniref:hypothetical protein n=1 Tax=Nitriliruptor alkaliphilus TaxID=427918 RepID=UPI000697E6A5|nr:hypothetical protein [Nitriliruptor alkaliphilus]